MMAKCMGVLVPLLLAICAVSASASASVQLPLNVDCGTTDNSTTGFLGMTWVGDEQYVKSGQSATVRIDHNNLIAPLTTLQYFPHQKKNCYSFPGVGQGLKILVRAWFYYGNYDGLSSPPTFDLLFNGNSWGRVSLSEDKYNGSAIFEVVHVTKVDDVSVCLVRTNPNDVPFINSLEIKLLDYSLYSGMDVNFPLYLKGRYAYALPARYIRSPDDIYDRVWLGFSFTNYTSLGLRPLTGSSEPTIYEQLAQDEPPPAVAGHGITTSSSYLNLTIPTLIDSTSPAPHYVNLYFVEMLPNASRSFDIFLDGQKFYPETIVPSGNVREISGRNVSASASSKFTLVRTDGSALPPLINAAEFFRVGHSWRDSSTDPSDVKALSELQKSYVQLQGWSGDPCLPIGYAWEWVVCSSEPAPQVTALYLSGYGLTGPLVDFSNLTALQKIDLHNNSLNGSIPEFLAKLPNLKQLNLAENQFSGSVPESLASNSKINLNISNNNISSSSRKKTDVGMVAGATISSLLLVMLAIFIFKKRQGKPTSALLEQEIMQHGFSHAEIVEITNNFEKVLGEGGSGNVYYGRLKNGNEVAVKVLKNSLSQGTKEFVAETISGEAIDDSSPQMLGLLCWVLRGRWKSDFLYEYMSGGNLRQLLSGRTNTPAFLTWEIRLQIALRIATGLDYLHSGCYPPIIHRDVKTTNILLNERMEAKVADFGLSKAGQKDDVTPPSTAVASTSGYIRPEYLYSCYGQKGDVTQMSTAVAGTPGYIDPEYYSTSLVTKKSDVYSFGVVLFELITGHPPIFIESGERLHIVEWVSPRLVKGDIHCVSDPKLRGQYNVNSMWKVADIAMSCTSQPHHSRPHMSNVVDQLKEAIELENNYQHRTDASFTEVELSSSLPYEFSSSSLSSSYLPPARYSSTKCPELMRRFSRP